MIVQKKMIKIIIINRIEKANKKINIKLTLKGDLERFLEEIVIEINNEALLIMEKFLKIIKC